MCVCVSSVVIEPIIAIVTTVVTCIVSVSFHCTFTSIL